MNKSLGWIAAIGLTLGVVFLGLAFAKGGSELDWLHGFDPAFVGDKPAQASAGMKQWDWTGDSLEIDVPAQVRVTAPANGTPAGMATIIVHGEQDMLDKVRFSNGKLALASRQHSFSRKEPLTVEVRGTFKNYAMAVGELKLGHIDQDRLSVRISGAGEASAEGKVTDLDIAISGVGGVEFGRLAAQTAHVKISGAGEAEIRPSERAEITLSGIGNVSLRSQPRNLVTHISGLGHVDSPDGDKDDDREN